MNINNFNEFIDDVILKRGYDYYLDGVVDVLNVDDGEYLFQVQGSNMYEVSVTLDNGGEIIYSQCDCPYDFGPICKHEVAAYYEINKIIKSEGKDRNIKKEKQPDLAEVLNRLSKEELINLIIDITKNDMVLKNNLLLMYSKDNYEQELEKCKRLISSIVYKYLNRNGYIDYRETGKFSSELYVLIEKARSTEDKFLALDILFLLLNTSIDAYEYADDSGGDIGGVVKEIFDEIELMVDEKEEYELNLQIEIFNKLLDKINENIFDGWSNYRIDLLKICAEFADIEECRVRLIEKIKQELNEKSNRDFTDYENEEKLIIIFHIVDKFGSKKEAEKFILDNIKYTYFKELYINKFIDEKNFDKAIKLTIEWQRSDSKNFSLVTKWKRLRYSIYKELSMEKEQKELAKELLFDGNFEYYIELKELMPDDNKAFYENLKSQLKKTEITVNKYINRRMFVQLIEYENDLDEILLLVKEQPSSVEVYGYRIFEKYPEEVIRIFENYIKQQASIASKRKDYANVCWKIEKYEKFAGKDRAIEMINYLMYSFKNRPAFIDELNKNVTNTR